MDTHKIPPDFISHVMEVFNDSMEKWESMHDIVRDLSRHFNTTAEKMAMNLTDEYCGVFQRDIPREDVDSYKKIIEQWIKNIFKSSAEIGNSYDHFIDGIKKKYKKEKNGK